MVIATVALAAVFVFAIAQTLRARDAQTPPFVSLYPDVASVHQLVPEADGSVSQERIDLNGDGKEELVIGFTVPERHELVSVEAPRARVFERVEGAWKLISTFVFAGTGTYRNATDAALLRGVPSFERKDINGDGHEELFVHLGVGSEFFQTITILVWQNNALTWLPIVGSDGQAILPIFSDGGTTNEVHRAFVQDANDGGGLEIIFARGTVSSTDGNQHWNYMIYVEHSGVYVFDPHLSSLYTARGLNSLQL